jgi:diguanylate cyclase (GGDEF)-like protein
MSETSGPGPWADFVARWPSPIALVDHTGVIVSVNAAWSSMTWRDGTANAAPGSNVLERWAAEPVPGGAADASLAELVRTVVADAASHVVVEPVPVRMGERARLMRLMCAPAPGGVGAFVMFVDVTEDRNGSARSAEPVALDGVTGLPAPVLLADRLAQLLRHRWPQTHRVAVLLVDLDSFSRVNDSFGSDFGDAALKAMTCRLSRLLADDEWVGRYIGDAFVVVLEGTRADHQVLLLADSITQAVAEPLDIDGRRVVLTAAVGVAFADSTVTDADELLRDAEEASEVAQARGRGQVEVSDGGVRVRALARLEAEQALRLALTNNELRLAYQAEVSMENGHVVGAEALLRWQRPGGVELQPDEFVSLAEETGLINPIGDWVLYEACRAAAEWPVVDGVELFVAVNLSAHQLSAPRLVDMVRIALNATGLPARRLCIELTESSLLGRLDDAVRVFEQLRSMGVLVALDDFGTGFSSLSYLRRLPVDIVKLDRTFVEEIETTPAARAIVSAVLSMAKSLGIGVVAEGVETEAQRRQLVELGCDIAQGFSLSRPIDEDAFIDLAQSRMHSRLGVAR